MLSEGPPVARSEFNGLWLPNSGHPIRLKWHRLRRRMSDPLFSYGVMQLGFSIGASMELDLRVRSDKGFVVLHDADLSGETTGTGRIGDLSREELQAVRFKEDSRPLAFTEDLATQLDSAHPDALLQFDMKDDFDAVGSAGVAHLADHFRHRAAGLIVSGDCQRLIGEMAGALPELRRGIDPTNRLVEAFASGGVRRVEDVLTTEIRSATQPDTIYLAWQLILRLDREGLDLVALCHAEGKLVDAWTFTPPNIGAGLTAAEAAQLRTLAGLKPDQITTDEAIALEQAWLMLQS